MRFPYLGIKLKPDAHNQLATIALFFIGPILRFLHLCFTGKVEINLRIPKELTHRTRWG